MLICFCFIFCSTVLGFHDQYCVSTKRVPYWVTNGESATSVSVIAWSILNDLDGMDDPLYLGGDGWRTCWDGGNFCSSILIGILISVRALLCSVFTFDSSLDIILLKLGAGGSYRVASEQKEKQLISSSPFSTFNCSRKTIQGIPMIWGFSILAVILRSSNRHQRNVVMTQKCDY